MADYITLDDDEKDEILVEFLMAQERDLFCHQINKERYDGILETEPEGPFRKRIQELKNQTEDRLKEVGSILDKTLPQLPDNTRIQAAKTRIRDKEAQTKR